MHAGTAEAAHKLPGIGSVSLPQSTEFPAPQTQTRSQPGRQGFSLCCPSPGKRHSLCPGHNAYVRMYTACRTFPSLHPGTLAHDKAVPRFRQVSPDKKRHRPAFLLRLHILYSSHRHSEKYPQASRLIRQGPRSGLATRVLFSRFPSIFLHSSQKIPSFFILA